MDSLPERHHACHEVREFGERSDYRITPVNIRRTAWETYLVHQPRTDIRVLLLSP